MAVMTYPTGSRPGRLAGIAGLLRFARLAPMEVVLRAQQTAYQHDGLEYWNLGPLQVYVVSNPDYIRQVLIDDHARYSRPKIFQKFGSLLFGEGGILLNEGQDWQRTRRLMQPAFQPRRIGAYAATMVQYTERMLATWRPGAIINLDQAMRALTLEIVARALFDADLTDGSSHDIRLAIRGLEGVITNAPEVMALLPTWLPTRQMREFRRTTATLRAVVERVIAQHRATGHDRGDLLSVLLTAHDAETDTRMSDQELYSNLVQLIFAGHETTATALLWSWCLLGQHPDAEARLHAELDSVLGVGPARRPPTLDDLPRLPYTAMVLDEALRLYPPGDNIAREALADVTIGGHSIPRGSLIFIYPYIVHRDPRVFEQPDAFRPERFADEARARIPRYSYIPFGTGPRVCIGSHFSLMEARLLLATIAQRYRLALLPGQQLRPTIKAALRPEGEIQVQLLPRT